MAFLALFMYVECEEIVLPVLQDCEDKHKHKLIKQQIFKMQMSVSFRVSNRGLGNQAMHLPTSNLSAYILAYKYCRKRWDVGLDLEWLNLLLVSMNLKFVDCIIQLN